MTLRVQIVWRNGRAYHYTRVPGCLRVRLPDLPFDDPAFLAAYVEATRTRPVTPRAPAGTIAHLVDALMLSARFQALSDDYRRPMATRPQTRGRRT